MLVAGLLLGAAPAREDGGRWLSACGGWIDYMETVDGLPPGLLRAVGVVESGRRDGRTGAVAPWPWTVNAGGRGEQFATAGEAVAAVRAAQAAGVQSVDVGCMQVSLLYHPHAFPSLEAAFEPAANVSYAAAFLLQLHAQFGNWAGAVAAYHSSEPDRGPAYARVVASVWPLAERYGMSATPPADGADTTLLGGGIDPGHVLTPAFRAKMQEAAAFARQHDPAFAGQQPASPGRTGGRSVAASLATAVDPGGTLTPAFRARMMAAEAFRRQMEPRMARGVRDRGR